jgi:GWxTD domain-containing protein
MKYCKLILGSLLFFGLISAQNGISQPNEAEKEDETELKFRLDYTRFRASDSLVYLEFYTSLPRSALTYVPEDERLRADFITTAQVLQGDSVIASKQWRNVNYADSLAEVQKEHLLFSQNHFTLNEGNYNLKVNINDPNSPISGEYTAPIEIALFSQTDLSISDLQMSSNITRSSEKTPFVKNGYYIMPHPSGVYGLVLPMLFSYAEVYHLSDASSDSGKYYTVEYQIMDADGKVVKKIEPKVREKPGESSVEVNALNVATLVSGMYTIVMNITDLENDASYNSFRKFFVYREADFADGGERFKQTEEINTMGSPGLDADRYDAMAEKQLDQEFEFTRYVSTKEERDTWKTLKREGKIKFLKEFWAKRDQTPTTPANEFKRDYLARVEYANRRFRGTFKDGWKTDRGRVILVYGQPDEVQRNPMTNEAKAYEVWFYYSIQGGVEFIFVDKRDMEDYELVHSTARGELYDPEWYRFVQIHQDYYE